MPSLFRFLLILLLLGLAGFGLVYALGTFVKPATRPMSQDIPLKNLEPAEEPPKP
ncbi:histidine kinase [Labrys okinawensis]|uniref:Histidine kinase n=1 Tax=Labrys okinawensis TaxID=346911 RepID=A0A2S9Q481_9HYPH|nr:histidine kinase [Labrys okinawensis]PRH84147.1 histidine kinase [Labrys okinawensis]